MLKHTSLFFQQVLLLVVVPQLWRFDLRGQLRIDVMTVADVVHPAAAARDDALDLLGLVHLCGLVPVCSQTENPTAIQNHLICTLLR